MDSKPMEIGEVREYYGKLYQCCRDRECGCGECAFIGRRDQCPFAEAVLGPCQSDYRPDGEPAHFEEFTTTLVEPSAEDISLLIRRLQEYEVDNEHRATYNLQTEIESRPTWPKGPTEWIEDRVLHVSIPDTRDLPSVRTRLMQRDLSWDTAMVSGPAVEQMPTYFDYLTGFVTTQKGGANEHQGKG